MSKKHNYRLIKLNILKFLINKKKEFGIQILKHQFFGTQLFMTFLKREIVQRDKGRTRPL